MAADQQRPDVAQSIRSLTDQDAIFRAFDSYPWTKDKEFMSGLHAILGDPNSPSQQGSPRDMATHARIFYYAQRIGTHIDFAAYQSWLASRKGQHAPPNILPPQYLPSRAAPVLDWQKAAPKADLYIDRSAAASAADADADAGGQPTYPMAFAEMLKLLQEGKEVPGIRQIPNTIIRDPAVKPVGARAAPRKPWERDVPTPSDDTYRITTLETEFPPIETALDQPQHEAA